MHALMPNDVFPAAYPLTHELRSWAGIGNCSIPPLMLSAATGTLRHGSVFVALWVMLGTASTDK